MTVPMDRLEEQIAEAMASLHLASSRLKLVELSLQRARQALLDDETLLERLAESMPHPPDGFFEADGA